MPDEAKDFIQITLERRLLIAIGRKYFDDKPAQIMNMPLTQSDFQRYDEIWIGDKKIELPHPQMIIRQPLIYGFMVFVLPKIYNQILYSSALGIKYSWVDENNQTIVNQHAKNLFLRVQSDLAKLLFSPIAVKNVYSDNILIVKNIGYTIGVKEWVTNGGELMQEGVKNNRFLLPT